MKETKIQFIFLSCIKNKHPWFNEQMDDLFLEKNLIDNKGAYDHCNRKIIESYHEIKEISLGREVREEIKRKIESNGFGLRLWGECSCCWKM